MIESKRIKKLSNEIQELLETKENMISDFARRNLRDSIEKLNECEKKLKRLKK